MTVATDALTIDRDDLTAMRKADSVVFRMYEGTATVECIKKDRDEFGEKERRRDIVVYGAISHAYWSYEDRQEFSSACVVMTSAQYVEQWRTVTQLLRVGDTLRLEFRADHGSNGHCKDANLHADELYLRVDRGTANKRMYFLLDAAVCLSNSARMVQP